MTQQIFLDLDGVIFDFEHAWTKMFGAPPIVNFDASRWTKFIDSGKFETLDLLPGAIPLLEHLQELQSSGQARTHILTSTGGFERHSCVMSQKLRALNSHGIDIPVIFVPSRRYKKAYATPIKGRVPILIDDHLENISEFSQAGGRGIRHLWSHWTHTIKDLKAVMDPANGDIT